MIAKRGDLVKPNIIASAKMGPIDHNPELAAALKQQDMLRSALVSLMEKYQLDALIIPYRTALDTDLRKTPNPPGEAGGGAMRESACRPR